MACVGRPSVTMQRPRAGAAVLGRVEFLEFLLFFSCMPVSHHGPVNVWSFFSTTSIFAILTTSCLPRFCNALKSYQRLPDPMPPKFSSPKYPHLKRFNTFQIQRPPYQTPPAYQRRPEPTSQIKLAQVSTSKRINASQIQSSRFRSPKYPHLSVSTPSRSNAFQIQIA